MTSDRLWNRLAKIEAGTVPDAERAATIRGLATILAGNLRSDDEAAEIAGRWEKALGPEGARELEDLLVWARARLAERNKEAMRVLLAEHDVDLDTASEAEIDAGLALAFPQVPAFRRRDLGLDPCLHGPEVLWSETWSPERPRVASGHWL